MGLLKDVYDIVSELPGVQDQINKATLDFLKGAFPTALTRDVRRANLRIWISQLTDDNFSYKFKNTLGFLGTLLGTTVEATYTASRGCVVEKLYLPAVSFYFPVPAKEVELGINFKHQVTGETLCALKDSAASPYVFYAIKGKDGFQPELSSLRDQLNRIARANPKAGEVQSFIDWLAAEGHDVVEVIGIGQDLTTNAYRYIPRDVMDLQADPSLRLDFGDTDTKAALASDLNAVLDFRLV